MSEKINVRIELGERAKKGLFCLQMYWLFLVGVRMLYHNYPLTILLY